MAGRSGCGRIQEENMSLDKYKLVEREKEPVPPDMIRISGQGRTGSYVTYAAKLFNEDNLESIRIRATGNALPKAVQVTEVVKRRFKGLHQITNLESVTFEDKY